MSRNFRILDIHILKVPIINKLLLVYETRHNFRNNVHTITYDIVE